ncbi:MAG: hypothetical protein HY870_17730, partial [Chloroflexi bacterium]|nr:hypothetical protein [Chloroflexota bacterium]
MIGTLHETELHAALTRHYARPSDQLEATVDGYVGDVLRADGVGASGGAGGIIEIQTHNFAALKHKLPRLLEQHAVTLVYPIAVEKWVVRVEANRRTVIGRRKSPHRGHLAELFIELV